MPKNTMTLALTGRVPFASFVEAMGNFFSLVDALSAELDAREGVKWFVDSLEASSAITTIRGESIIPGRVETVVNGYAVVGKALMTDEIIPYSSNVAQYANNLAGLLGTDVTGVIFQTEEEDSIISTLPTLPLPLKPAYGALAGRIQTLTNRATLRFTLFDDLYDRAVSCYIQEGHEDILRAVWGKRAIVEGLISRDPQSGRPLSIRGVSNIRPIPEENGDYRKARGILPPPEGADKPEDIIRRMRDG